MTFEQIRSILSGATVGIAGAGGLGSNCASALVRCGIGRLIIADFDVVDASNLNRQFFFFDQIGQTKVRALEENLHRIRKDVVISAHKLLLTPDNIPEIFAEAQILVEAFDQADQKAMLIETMVEHWPEKPLIIGSGMAGFGQTELIRIRRTGNLYLCGDEISEISRDNPPIAPRVGIVANMQADKVIELLIHKTIDAETH